MENAMEMEIVIECYGKQIEKGNQKFVAYKAKMTAGENVGKYIDIRFTKESGMKDKLGRFNLVAIKKNLNKDRNSIYPRVWCKKVERIEEIARTDDLADIF